MRLVLDVIAVHEDVLAARVAVQVTIENYVSFIPELTYQFLDCKVHWVNYAARSFPSSIKVLSRQGTSIISIDHSVGIQYWNDLEHKMVTQSFGLRCMADKVFDRTFHHPGGVTLTGMDSRAQKDPLLRHSFRTLRILVLASDRKVFTLVACQRPR